MKKLKTIGLSLMLVSSLFTGCGSSGSEANNINTTSSEIVTTEAQTEPQTEATTKATTKATTEKPTEAQKTINDIYNEIKAKVSNDGMSVCLREEDKEIAILILFEGAALCCRRSRTDGDFSVDAYELWLDTKSDIKDLSESLSKQYLSGSDYSDWSIACYLLDDETHSSLPTYGEEFTYIMKTMNGYCMFDASDT